MIKLKIYKNDCAREHVPGTLSDERKTEQWSKPRMSTEALGDNHAVHCT